eukprot:2723405-Rhodomonas_salina.1
MAMSVQPQTTRKLAGRMCFGVSLPMTGHTAYVFDIRTSGSIAAVVLRLPPRCPALTVAVVLPGGDEWKLTKRYSEFLDLDEKLRQVRAPFRGQRCGSRAWGTGVRG